MQQGQRGEEGGGCWRSSERGSTGVSYAGVFHRQHQPFNWFLFITGQLIWNLHVCTKILIVSFNLLITCQEPLNTINVLCVYLKEKLFYLSDNSQLFLLFLCSLLSNALEQAGVKPDSKNMPNIMIKGFFSLFPPVMRTQHYVPTENEFY